ncbi:MAG: ATP-binding protein, partial [Bacteroidota bacterium]
AVLLTLLVSLRVADRMSRPLLEIAHKARAVARGETTGRVRWGSRDEIGEIAAALDAMAEKLGADIEKLRRLERVRSEFLANVSHELRTPIFSMQGFIETLLDGALDDPSVNRDFLEKAHRHADRLNALLNDLIDISRIESGEMKMSFRYFAVNGFLAGVLDEMRAKAERKSLSLALGSLPEEGEEAYGDRERLRQVMVNLLDNAVKYTAEGGRITVSASSAKGRIVIEVSDTGCGIPAEHLPRIFERFYRVDRDRSRQVGGTGLGLAIVKHIIEAHGGTITAASEPGKGSVFTFTLKR